MSPTALSFQGLDRAASMSENDFEFLGKNRHLKCTFFQAVFISPRVDWLLQQDATLDSFVVEWRSQGINENRVFEFLEHLMNGEPIDALACEVEGLLEVATLLGNTELINSFICDEAPIDRLTVCGRLSRKSVAGQRVDEEIEFAASHFFEISPGDLKELGVTLLEGIVISEGLCLASEDSLLDFIISLGWDEE
jgi:hypothetical protein